MAKVTVRRVVPGSQERVWHVLSDLDRFPEWLPNLERIEHSGGPARGLHREHTSYLADGTELHQKIVAWDNARRVGWRIERELRGGTEVGGYHSARTDIDCARAAPTPRCPSPLHGGPPVRLRGYGRS